MSPGKDRTAGSDRGESGIPPADAIRRLEAHLRRELGSRRARVEADGAEREIAVLRVPPDLVPALLDPGRRARIVAEARRQGFRYAALDLALERGAGDPLSDRGGALA